MSIQYPAGTTGDGLVEMTYYADGSLATRTDQRDVKLTFTYDDSGRRWTQEVTSGNGGGLAFRVQDKGNYYFVGPSGSQAAVGNDE